MGHEAMADNREELVKIAVRLWDRIREAKGRKESLERELRLVEAKIATLPKGVETDAEIR